MDPPVVCRTFSWELLVIRSSLEICTVDQIRWHPYPLVVTLRDRVRSYSPEILVETIRTLETLTLARPNWLAALPLGDLPPKKNAVTIFGAAKIPFSYASQAAQRD